MKARFAPRYLLILLLGYFSETFSKLLNSEQDKTTEYFSLLTAVIPDSAMVVVLNGNPSEPQNLTRITSDRLIDNTKSMEFKEAQRNKEEPTNVTIKRDVKQDNKFQSKLSPIGDYVFGSLVLGSCILSLLGNGCALTIFRFRQRRLIPIEVFFINLAITNLLLSVASYPLSIVSSFMHGWNFRELGCTIYGFSCYLLGLSSIYTITAMAFTRYLITCRPVRGNQITCCTCCKMVAISYLLAFLWALLPLLGYGRYDVEPFGLSCTLDWIAKDRASRVYIVLVTILCVFLPLIILLFSYGQIIMLVKGSSAVVKNTRANNSNKKGSSDQLTWICGLISTGFVIAWFPYTIVCLWTSFQGEVALPIWLTPGPSLFAKASIVYNPIIYVFLTARYQKDFNDLVKYISCKSGVRRRKASHDPQIVTATEVDRSTFQCKTRSTYVDIIEEDILEIFNSDDPGTMKETCV